MKRPLFVFAGQSNMMGASVFQASEQIFYKNSFEYLHKARRFGNDAGEFKNYGFPVGEFSYKDLVTAYGRNSNFDSISTLDNYLSNTFFCPSMCNLKDREEKTIYPFSFFSEVNNRKAVSLAPYIVKGLEDNDFACAYTHIAKGGVPINYYLEGNAADYFYAKVADFFAECQKRFQNDGMNEKVLVWLQGESDANNGFEYYLDALKTFWERAKEAGFTKFLIVRVGYFGNTKISDIMRAQEEFCKNSDDSFIITRVCSFLKWQGNEPEGWFDGEISDEFTFCRDSFYGFANQHINEKGFKVIAKYAVPNIIRILFENKTPLLEEEKVSALLHM